MEAPLLIPKRPPGRNTRKAGAYSAEIQRLQAAGYTLDAIRESLAAAGLVVSKSTVHREAARWSARRTAMTPRQAQVLTPGTAKPPAFTASDGAGATSPQPAPEPPQRGRDIAAAFVSSRISNPLLRKDPR